MDSGHRRFLGRFPTPCAVLPTHLGQLLYSPVELRGRLDEPVLGLVDVADAVNKDFGAVEMAKLCTQNSNVTYILAPRGTNGCAVNSNASGVFVDTKGGRKLVTVEQFIERVKLDTPAAVIPLADEVSYKESHKRLRKASDRTRLWNEQVAKHVPSSAALLGVCQAERLDGIPAAVEELLRGGVQAVVAGGVYTDPTSSAAERAEVLHRIRAAVGGRVPVVTLHSAHFEHQTYMQPTDEERTVPKLNFKKDKAPGQQSQQQVPKPKPEPVEQTFGDVLDDLTSGADVVYSMLPLKLTMQGKAFCVRPPVDLHDVSNVVARQYGSSVAAPAPAPVEQTEEAAGEKRGRSDEESAVPAKRAKVVDASPAGEAFCVDLWSPVFERDGRPLVEGCGCIACERHTRAYVHHLLKSRELLAEVLLYQHNQWQLLDAFKTIRTQVDAGTFEQWKSDVLAAWQLTQ